MAAGVGREAAAACTGEGFIIIRVKNIFGVWENIAGWLGMSNEIGDQGQDAGSDDHRRLLPDFGFDARVGDGAGVKVNVLHAQTLRFAGHHAGVDHEQGQGGEGVAAFVQVPEGGLFLGCEGLALLFFQRRQDDIGGQVFGGVAVRARQFEKV